MSDAMANFQTFKSLDKQRTRYSYLSKRVRCVSREMTECCDRFEKATGREFGETFEGHLGYSLLDGLKKARDSAQKEIDRLRKNIYKD